MDKSSAAFGIINAVLSQPGNSLSVSQMCRCAGVSRSGFYAWKKAAELRASQEERDQQDFRLILEAYSSRSYTKGARGIAMCLLHRNPPVVMNLKKIRRLMKKYKLRCPIRKANPYRRMAKAMKTDRCAENLLDRQFECYGPRMVLLTDITYIPYQGKFAYLSTILDAFTKQILSYSLSESMEIDFVLETVGSLLQKHGSTLKTQALIHSDQGCHYTSSKFIEVVENSSLRRSMSRRGNCWDNAPQESFFGHMKDSIDLHDCISFQQVKAAVDDYMNYYNNERYQWKLAKLSPNEYYSFITTGVYPLPIENPPALRTFQRNVTKEVETSSILGG